MFSLAHNSKKASYQEELSVAQCAKITIFFKLKHYCLNYFFGYLDKYYLYN